MVPRVRLLAPLLLVMLELMLGSPAGVVAQIPHRSPAVRLPAPEHRVHAPAFPAAFKWLNTDQPLALDKQLKGHVVVLDFWTFCCINCMHILPDLSYLEHKYADQPVVIVGVHSAKFDSEADARNIQSAIERYRIEHPVLVDQHHQVWDAYAVRAWPTFVVIDTTGRVVGQMSGEGKRALLDTVVSQLLEEGRKNGTLAAKPFKPHHTAAALPTDRLAFPGKIAADPAHHRLVIADSNHDRLVVISLDGKVQQVIGSGERGLRDGPLATAQFNNPQGLAIDGDVIYVADTDNHALRRVDLKIGSVTTLAGNGQQSYDRTGGGRGTEQGLSSPWDLALDGGKLYIAMAGNHQLWVHDLATGRTSAFVGTGQENILDGPADQAMLAQPSGLSVAGGWLYFADSEVSALRRASLADGHVETLIGTGLFDFGDRDGDLKHALLQHPLGVAALDPDTVFIADTYNNALRRVDLKSHTITTLLGGPKSDALNEPAGLAILDGLIYLADTNHHRILRYNPKTRQTTPLPITITAH